MMERITLKCYSFEPKKPSRASAWILYCILYRNGRCCYADIDSCNANYVTTNLEKLWQIKANYRPGSEGSCKFVVVVGDHATFKILFRLWRESLIGEQEGSGLHLWMIPLPGGFHIENRASPERRAGLKELMVGFYKNLIATFDSLSSYRKIAAA